MAYWTFVSYARSDRDHFVEQFISDLREEIRRKHVDSLTSKSILFFDTSEMETGTEWEDALAAALRTSRTLVCLCSPGYLNSDYCGREFQVFCRRRDAWMRQTGKSASHTKVILPILWELPRGPLPTPLARFQTADDDFPRVYAEEGVRYMMKLNRHRDDYMQFVDRLAAKLVTAGSEARLPDLDELPPLRQVTNPFRGETGRGTVRTDGPNSAKFVFIAATSQEISQVRESTAFYAEEGGWFWRPFLPGVAECVGTFAQLAATNLNLRYSELRVHEALIQELEEARQNREAVILVADPWTMCVAEYARLMRAYDNLTLINCGVLVAWNDLDNETVAGKPMLERNLREAFPQKIVLRPPGHDWESVRSAQQLRAKLEEVLTHVRMMIIQMCAPERKAESPELMQQAAAAGISTWTKPILWGPGGERH